MFDGYVVAEPNGAPAKDRFRDPAAVRAVYEKLSEDDLKESGRRAKIRKLYDGNLPFNPEDLKNSGLRNLTNVNFLGLKGVIDNRADVILKLKSDTSNLIELKPIAPEYAGHDAVRVASVIEHEFSWLLRSNGRFINALAMMNKEADLYGIGPVVWKDDVDYVPTALERGQIRFLENASVCSSDNDLYLFESTISAEFLQSLRDNREMAAQLGWDMTQVDYWFKEIFANGADTTENTAADASTSPLESALSQYRRNIVAEDKQFDEFKVIHVFVREIAWPRHITHIMTPSTEYGSKFLYYKRNAFPTMDDCFIWFPFSTKDRFAREVRGLGTFLYAADRLKNRFMCQFFDSAFRAASLVLSQQAGTGPVSSQLTVNEVGPYTVLPAGVTPSQAQVAPNFQHLIQVSQVLDQVSTQSFLGTEKSPIATTATKLFKGSEAKQSKEEVELQNAIRAHRTEAEFAERKDIVDRICRNCFRRALNLMLMPDFARVDYPEIGEFLQRCAIRGVTIEHLMAVPQLYTIESCSDLALGADGKAAELDLFRSQYGGDLDETGRKKIARRRAELRFGQKDADLFIPEISRDQAPSDQSSFATMENNQMKLGFEVMVGEDQIHWSHIPVHAQLLQEIVQMVAAPKDNTPDLNEFNGDPNQTQHIAEQTLQNLQEDPKKVLGILVMCSQHVQGHLQFAQTQIGKEGDAKNVAKMLRDLRPTIKALNLAVATQERVEQAQKEQAERDRQKEIEAAAEEKARVAQIEADRKAETERYRIDREHEVQMHKADLEAGRVAATDGREAQRFANDEARKDAALQGQLEREQKLNEAKVNAASAVGRMNAVQEATGFGSVPPGDIAEMGPAGIESL